MSRPRRRWIFIGLFVLGIVNGLIVLRPFSRDPIQPLPISAAIAPARPETQLGLRAYLSFAKSQVLAAGDRDDVHAAIMFLSYFLLSTRGIGDACDRTGTDLSAAKATFANVHQVEYDRASAVLAVHGVDSNIVWHLFKGNLTRLADLHLEQYGTRADTTRAETCASLATDPESFAAVRFFRTNYPALHAQLMH